MSMSLRDRTTWCRYLIAKAGCFTTLASGEQASATFVCLPDCLSTTMIACLWSIPITGACRSFSITVSSKRRGACSEVEAYPCLRAGMLADDYSLRPNADQDHSDHWRCYRDARSLAGRQIADSRYAFGIVHVLPCAALRQRGDGAAMEPETIEGDLPDLRQFDRQQQS